MKAALAVGHHQGVRYQQRQGFAQGARSHAIHILQMLDPQSRAGRQPSFDDVAPQVGVRGLHLGFAGYSWWCGLWLGKIYRHGKRWVVGLMRDCVMIRILVEFTKNSKK